MRALLVLAGFAAVALGVVLAAKVIVWTDGAIRRRRERRHRIEDYQDTAALEDLDRTRRRINEAQDRMYDTEGEVNR